jgi:Putative addiction module component
MGLPEDDRVKLANELLASLHGNKDADIAAAWDIEICGRINDIQIGHAELIDASDIIARAKSRLST